MLSSVVNKGESLGVTRLLQSHLGLGGRTQPRLQGATLAGCWSSLSTEGAGNAILVGPEAYEKPSHLGFKRKESQPFIISPVYQDLPRLLGAWHWPGPKLTETQQYFAEDKTRRGAHVCTAGSSGDAKDVRLMKITERSRSIVARPSWQRPTEASPRRPPSRPAPCRHRPSSPLPCLSPGPGRCCRVRRTACFSSWRSPTWTYRRLGCWWTQTSASKPCAAE